MNSNKTILFYAFIIFSLLCFFVLPNVLAFTKSNVGNFSSSIEETYGPGEALKGWINISLSKEPFNSLLEGFNGSIKIYDLLKKNNFVWGIHFNCTTADCDIAYSTSDSGSTTKTFVLNSGQNKTFGFLIKANDFDMINNIDLNITSNALEDSSSQLKINIGKDDDSYAWYFDAAQPGSYSSSKNYGCYAYSINQADLSSDPYCQTINASASPGFRIGANITAISGTANLVFSASSGGMDASCSVIASSSGEIGCDISNFSLFKPNEIYVCVRQSSGSGKFKISYDSAAPICGNNYDYGIFLQSIKYAKINNFAVNKTKLEESFSNLAQAYINNLYDGDCSKECYIPLIFHSNQDGQSITINKAEINYKLLGPLISSNTIYELSSASSLIDMPFRKLNLPGPELSAPSKPGFYNLSLKLGNYQILKKGIIVLNLPIINEIYPVEVPAGANIYFTVLASGGNITNYKWDFGDNSTLSEVSSNHITHNYNDIRDYNVVVFATNNHGTSNKTFKIRTISPKDYLPIAFADYEKSINATRAQINTFPTLVKNRIESQLDLRGIELKLATLKARYKTTNSSLDYISIANSLLTINIPDTIALTDKASGRFIIDRSKIDLNALFNITSESIGGKEEVIKDSLFKWFIDSLTVDADYSGFFAFYQNYSVPLFSYYNVRVSPNSNADIDKVYAIVLRPSTSVIFGNGVSGILDSGNSVGFSFDSGSKTFDFAVLNEKIGLLDMPLYFSPQLSSLALGYNISACNFNQKCQKDLGENSGNCRTDCKPWVSTIFWLFMVLIFFLIAYIGAQEWYKSRYENYLFKDKNDLFNIIHFISNAEGQGLKKEEIFQKLKEKGWHNEQLVYAYKKFKGERTGMWEIPILKFFENEKIFKEINLRNRIGFNPKIIPKPNQPFIKQPLFFGKPVQNSQTQLPQQIKSDIKLSSFDSTQKTLPQKPAEQKQMPSENSFEKEPK